MTRGEVWWAELAGTAGFRPVVIVSRSEDLDRRGNVTVAEITRVVRSLPCEVSLSTSDGMPADCVINTDNIHTIPRERFRQRILSLSAQQMFSLERALRHSFGLEW